MKEQLPLTAAQLANWRKAFPELFVATDEEIQKLADLLSSRISEAFNAPEPDQRKRDE